MDIDELKKEKERVELEMHEALRRIINDFHARTGLSIKDISVDMFQVMSYTNPYFIHRVLVKLDLDL